MTPRRPLALLLAAAVLVSGACSGDDADGDDAKATTTKAEVTTTTAAPATTVTTLPVGTEPEPTSTTAPDSNRFTSKLAEASAAIDAAGDDFCKVGAATRNFNAAGQPATVEDLMAFLAFYTKVLNKVADTVPADSGIDPDVLRNTATALNAEAQAKGYPVNLFTGTIDTFTDETTLGAMRSLTSYLQSNCPPAGG